METEGCEEHDLIYAAVDAQSLLQKPEKNIASSFFPSFTVQHTASTLAARPVIPRVAIDQ